MLTLDLEEDENRTFFYRNATESRKNITEKEPNLMNLIFFRYKSKNVSKMKILKIQ